MSHIVTLALNILNAGILLVFEKILKCNDIPTGTLTWIFIYISIMKPVASYEAGLLHVFTWTPS